MASRGSGNLTSSDVRAYLLIQWLRVDSFSEKNCASLKQHFQENRSVKGSDLPFILIFSDFLGCEKLFSPPESLFCKMQMQNKMYFGVLRSPSEPGWQHFLVLRSNLHFDLSKIQVGTNWLSRRHPHIGFNFKNVMMLSPSLSLLSYFFLD